MRWKLLRRRLSISAPRVMIRSHLPWPLRWAALAVMLGFSGAIALWAFEFGREIAGLDYGAKKELAHLRAEVERLTGEYERAKSFSNTAESLLRTERAAQERLAQQVRQLEAERQTLRQDLGFFERLLPAEGEGLQVRGLMAEPGGEGQLRYQMLVMQNGGRNVPEFSGRYELLLTGQLEGRPWTLALPGGGRPLALKQYTRVEGLVEIPAGATVKSVQAKVMDAKGAVRASQTLKL
jgi:multidrug efflux pump subunit AcrA (membrane-fusion protein)